MHHDQNPPRAVWAPLAYAYEDESIVEAAERHCQETGHVGGVIIAAIIPRPPAAPANAA